MRYNPFHCTESVLLPSKDTFVVDGEACRGRASGHSQHYTFIGTLPSAACRRNPRLFDGKYVTLTRWNDGTLHLFFKKMKTDVDFTVDGYASEVANEIRQALKGLVEEKDY